jgi:hypothetical protein
MIQDCRANKPAGWSYFVTNFVPFCRAVVDHYCPDRRGDPELLNRVLLVLKQPASSFFSSFDPATEREFVTHLRQFVLAAVEPDIAGDAALDLETFSSALEPLTVVERQIVWLETMDYDTAPVSALMHVSPETVEKVKSTAGELLRAKLDHWTRSMIRDNGPRLRRAVEAFKSDEPLPVKAFLDALDGRITWARRRDMERQLANSWYEIDHFCRVREADSLLRASRPLTHDEAEPYRLLLQVPAEKPPFWKRILAESRS